MNQLRRSIDYALSRANNRRRLALVLGLALGAAVLAPAAEAGATTPASTVPVGALSTQMADINGDGKADVFQALPAPTNTWQASYGAATSWVPFNSGQVDTSRTWLADINGDGKDDVFQALPAPSNTWQVSYGGTTSWVEINTGQVDPSRTWLVDMNGDGVDDVFQALPAPSNTWEISYGGTTPWVEINSGQINGPGVDPEADQIIAEAAAEIRSAVTPPAAVEGGGDVAVLNWFLAFQNDSAYESARIGLGDGWKVIKCGAAIGVTVASAVFAASKILKIKQLIKAAGGLKKTAQRVVKAFKKSGSLTTKATAGFGDLGTAVVELAVVILGIDTVIDNCS